MEWDKRDAAMASGELTLTDAMADSLKLLADECGLKLELY